MAADSAEPAKRTGFKIWFNSFFPHQVRPLVHNTLAIQFWDIAGQDVQPVYVIVYLCFNIWWLPWSQYKFLVLTSVLPLIFGDYHGSYHQSF
jgi:hypothetical protein